MVSALQLIAGHMLARHRLRLPHLSGHDPQCIQLQQKLVDQLLLPWQLFALKGGAAALPFTDLLKALFRPDNPSRAAVASKVNHKGQQHAVGCFVVLWTHEHMHAPCHVLRSLDPMLAEHTLESGCTIADQFWGLQASTNLQ